MKKLSTQFKIKSLILITHTLFIGGVFFTSGIAWYHWLLTVLSVAIIGKIGGEIGFHRYFAHRSFETTYWKSRVLLILGSLNMVGSTLSWCGTHRVHHRYAETDNDPHSPYTQNPWKVWLLMWKPFVISNRYVADMIKDPWQLFIHKWYTELCLATMLVVGLIDFNILLFGLLLPSIVQFHVGSLLIDIVCHKWGYRNYETTDQSRNNIWVNIFTGGSGLHNNHHGRPGEWDYAHKPGEWDIWGTFIRYALIKK